MRYLVDTSVLARARQDVVGERLAMLAQAGQLWTWRLIDLEVDTQSYEQDFAALLDAEAYRATLAE